MNLLRFLPVALTVAIVGCSLSPGSDIAGSNAGPRPSSATALSPSASCAQLAKGAIAPGSIGLPTRGASVTSVMLVAAQPATEQAAAIGEYCRVNGIVRSVDPSAENIEFRLNLPTAWNGRVLQVGGGSMDGTLATSDGTGNVPVSVVGSPTPLARGFATFGSDSGHQGGGVNPHSDGSFGLNREEAANFAGDAIKKTHDAALVLIRAYYSAGPQHVYFAGGSTGGREAFVAVQRYPQDYDGVFAAYPGNNQIELYLQHVRIAQALYAPGGWLGDREAGLLYRAVLSACDGLDGVRDGIISDPAACRFHPDTLRCQDGQDTGDACLSDRQIETVRTYAERFHTAFTLAGGQSSIGGYNIFAGADFTGTLGYAPGPVEPSNAQTNASTYISGSQFLKYFIVGDANYDALRFDTIGGGTYVSRLDEASREFDVTDPDLRAFAQRGGKLLWVHGTADAQVPTQASIDYYNRIVATMGQQRVDGFLRFYLIPGYGHGVGTFRAGFDALGALDDWVSHDNLPSGLIVRDNNAATFGRSRPLCQYPGWPRYVGHGDVNEASSFVCVGP
ncbi:tannase/feruloyl esterase family alpha/beta hydrolase [Paraburkholderia sp.]|uniref:tannase/feruloyl esterase family alpha/beta hydrolase n=1 Tax=Paraburkholderia sp. TaxID=1926495 RepID=UPI003C7C722D